MASADADSGAQSEDFTELNSTTARDQLDGRSEEELVKERSNAIDKLRGICGDDDGSKRPLRIVIVGKHGAGKSSFINGVAAALSEDCWHEYAYTGDLGRGAPITVVNERYVKCCNGDMERYKRVLLPTLIDVAGLSDEADDKMEELLRLLFYGHIEEEEAVMKVYGDCRSLNTDALREKYRHCFPDMRVDRIIFVASVAEPLPERLIACVHRAARPSHHMNVRRAVPLYGVLTKQDKVDLSSTDFKETQKRFMQQLGLNKSRFLVCSNYCDDLDPDSLRTQQLRTDLDIPIVRFMQQVCDSALKVTREDEELPVPATNEKQQNDENEVKQAGNPGQVLGGLDPVNQDWVLALVMGLVALALQYILLPSSEGPWERNKQMLGQLLISFIIGGIIFFLSRYLNRRG